ncbi:DUF1003 domain-containing protein [Simkania negevensis]|uniref:DUF1003 domain-containing protein n=1 Tax=Simkania negevensis (strain ATCC VR-1471 / DSM 27360 / Z) TaxID=331113 RepID=F8L3T5_SIMNZ|nr:DUF1003 domain-containing protein [Simkania negevensis]CCB89957.1 putative uncharacterized protein [Simkania negevensis Z]
MSVNHNHKKGKCEVCQKEFPYRKLFPIRLMRPTVLDTALQNLPEMNLNGYVCQEDLRILRTKHIASILEKDKGAISQFEEEVLESFKNQDLIVENVNKKFEKRLSIGERLADLIAKFGGSWKFILIFLAVIVAWMIINTFFFTKEGFDPYPFILLNLVLSCLAAIQAPVIMMSQNRQAEKERMRANEDYVTNLKAELEIQQLHSKLDLFMKRHWETMLDLQQIQIELAEDLLKHKHPKKE